MDGSVEWVGGWIIGEWWMLGDWLGRGRRSGWWIKSWVRGRVVHAVPRDLLGLGDQEEH